MGIVIDHKVYEGSHLLAGEYSDAHMDTEKLLRIPWLHALEKMVLKERRV